MTTDGVTSARTDALSSRETARPPHNNSAGPHHASFRIVLVSFLSAGIGIVAGFVAYALYKLIGLFTNIFFFHRWSTDFTSVRLTHLGAWVIVIPVIGGLIVGVMAKYGTPKIKGHGIPEAMEAVLINQSRIAPRVAILKPIWRPSRSAPADRLERKVPSFRPAERLVRWLASFCTPRRPSAKCCWRAALPPECPLRSTPPSRA